MPAASPTPTIRVASTKREPQSSTKTAPFSTATGKHAILTAGLLALAPVVTSQRQACQGDEPKATLDQVAAHGARSLGLGRRFTQAPPGILQGPAADELPDVPVEGPVLALNREERARVGDRGLDLRAITDDARVVHEAPDTGRGVAADFLWIESVERLPIRRALLENGRPADARLSAFQDQQLEEQTVLVDRHAPLPIVIGDVELTSGPAAASLVHPILRGRWYYRART